jgi:hypothetical protein
MRSLYVVLLLLLLPVSAHAQHPQPDPQHPEYRDPAMATALSALVPGAGHLYAGETGTGIAIVTTSIGAPLAGLLLSVRSERRVCTASGCRIEQNLVPLFVGAGVTLAAYIYGIADAGRAADRANRRRGLVSRVHVQPRVTTHEGRLAGGLAFRLRW